MMKVTQRWFLCCFYGLALGCTYNLHSGTLLVPSDSALARCDGNLSLSDTIETYTVSATKGSTYVFHLGQDLKEQLQAFLPGMHINQEGSDAVGTKVALEFGPRTSAHFGATIFSGKEVIVELKYAVRAGSGDSIVSSGTVIGNGSKPTGAIGLLGWIPIFLPVVLSVEQSTFKEASQIALSSALTDLSRQLRERGICRLL